METQSTEAVPLFLEPTLVPDGIHHLLDETVYRRDPAIAISDLKEMSISPAHFYSKKFGGYRAEQTGAQYIGTLTHLSVLEAEEYAKQVVLEPVDAPRKPTSARNQATKRSLQSSGGKIGTKSTATRPCFLRMRLLRSVVSLVVFS
jgi:hypothetical protein